MSESQQDAAPESGDPDIEALLQFEPVPRKREVDGAWTPELQREFIRRLAITGSPGRASEEMGKTETGVRKMYRSPEAASFRAAWHAAVALAKGRKAGASVADEAVAAGSRPPSIDNRRKAQRTDLDWEGKVSVSDQQRRAVKQITGLRVNAGSSVALSIVPFSFLPDSTAPHIPARCPPSTSARPPISSASNAR